MKVALNWVRIYLILRAIVGALTGHQLGIVTVGWLAVLLPIKKFKKPFAVIVICTQTVLMLRETHTKIVSIGLK